MDMLIKNGMIVNSDTIVNCDIAIDSGRISAVGKLDGSEAGEVIDATGLYVLPGIVDVHNHIDHVGGAEKTRDDFFAGTKSAACGGVTTLLDFAMQKNDETVMDAIARRREQADGKVCIDYGLHANITSLDPESEKKLPEIIMSGYPSLKLFMTYRKAGFIVDDPILLKVLKEVNDAGGIVGIHAENDAICEYLTDYYVKNGFISPEYHAKSRPNIVEAECISRAILFAEYTNSSLYIFHLTTKEGLKLVRDAKARGVKVYAETCPHYLTLTDSVYAEGDAYKYIMTPPLRTSEDIEALWSGIDDGTISIVSSDHCCYATDQKQINEGESFRDITPGIPGNETLLPIVHHFGVNSGRISINQMAALLTTNPAKMFGIYPQKGSLIPGTDADVVLFDPEKEVLLSDSMINMATDYTPYSGISVRGYPVQTIFKGKVIVQDGKFNGAPGAGRFLERAKPDLDV